jgi:hypothetical protein
MTIRAHVVHDFFLRGIGVYIVDSIDEHRARVMQPEGSFWQWVEHDPATNLDLPPTFRLPEDAARALLDSLAGHFGGVSEVQTLRKDYLAERGRVDKLTDAIIRQAAALTPVRPHVETVAERLGYPTP